MGHRSRWQAEGVPPPPFCQNLKSWIFSIEAWNIHPNDIVLYSSSLLFIFFFLLISFENWPLFLVHPQNLSPTFRSNPTHLLIQCVSRHHPKVFVFSPDFFSVLSWKFLHTFWNSLRFRDRKGQRPKGVKTSEIILFFYFNTYLCAVCFLYFCFWFFFLKISIHCSSKLSQIYFILIFY